MQNVFQEQKSKCEIVISRLEESDNDTNAVKQICNNLPLGFSGHPTETKQLGKKVQSLRLLLVTFDSEFPAKNFRNTVNVMKSKNLQLPRIEVRQNLDEETRKKFSEKSKLVFSLNQEIANSHSCDKVKFSLHENGIICKYTARSNLGERSN